MLSAATTKSCLGTDKVLPIEVQIGTLQKRLASPLRKGDR